MKHVLAQWNALPFEDAVQEILPCCGSKGWARAMAERRPVHDEAALLAACDQVWNNLPESDWMEALRSHPRIGESKAPAGMSLQSAAWSKTEQQEVDAGDKKIKAALAEGNRAYEEKFGRIFIVCATGKSAQEILEILGRRLRNEERTELPEAAEQQRQIAQIRLKKWLAT